MSNKIRVLYLIGELGRGGSERQLYLLLKYMDLKTIEPYVIVFNNSAYSIYNDELVRVGANVEVIPNDKKGVFSRLIYIYKRARVIRPHVIQSWSVHDNPYAGIIGLVTRIPLRLGSLRSSLYYAGFASLPKLIQLICLYSIQYIVVNSEATSTELLQRKYPKQKILFLRNCVDICEINPTSEIKKLSDLGITNSNRIIGTVGNIRRNKNFHIFIDGLGRLIEKYPDLRGIIVGQPIPDEQVYYQELQNLLSRKQLADKIHLMGFQDNIPQLMHHMHVFCLLSESEGTPNVILEAMAASRPVVASKVDGITRIISNGENGYLVNPGDTDNFVNILERLIVTPELVRKIGAAGYRLVESQFNCKEISNQLVDTYMNLLRTVDGFKDINSN